MNCIKIFHNEFIRFIFLIGVLVLLYWGSIELYYYFCVPKGYLAPFKLMLNLGSPTCLFVNRFQYEIANNYVSVWWITGGSIIAYTINRLRQITDK